jgi:hypothetical protein
MSIASVFNTAYVLSRDPRVQALFTGYMGFPGTALDPTVRYNTAYQLALSGLLIDAPIDAYAGDPYTYMYERIQYGYTWVPSALAAPITLAPGLSYPGIPSYNPNPPYPPGSIKVSINLADYPPFAVPVPPVTTVPYVGSYAGNGFYFASEAAQTTFLSNEKYTQAGVDYYFVVGSMGAFGATYFWRIVGT